MSETGSIQSFWCDIFETFANWNKPILVTIQRGTCCSAISISLLPPTYMRVYMRFHISPTFAHYYTYCWCSWCWRRQRRCYCNILPRLRACCISADRINAIYTHKFGCFCIYTYNNICRLCHRIRPTHVCIRIHMGYMIYWVSTQLRKFAFIL